MIQRTGTSSESFQNFLSRVWNKRDQLFGWLGNRELSGPETKNVLDGIYAEYEGEPQTPKQSPFNCTPAVQQLAQLASSQTAFNVFIQFPTPVPNYGNGVSVQQLWDICSAQSESDPQSSAYNEFRAAYENLTNRFHYYQLKGKASVNANRRVVVNTTPQNAPTAFAQVLNILGKYQAIAVAAKVAGPKLCARKADCIAVYFRCASSNDEEDLKSFLTDLRQGTSGLTVQGTPAMTNEIEPNSGIAVGHEPPPVQDSPISFGQKRAIAAYYAYVSQEPTSQEEFTNGVLELFKHIGINPQAPHEETGQRNEHFEEDIKKLLTVMNPGQ